MKKLASKPLTFLVELEQIDGDQIVNIPKELELNGPKYVIYKKSGCLIIEPDQRSVGLEDNPLPTPTSDNEVTEDDQD